MKQIQCRNFEKEVIESEKMVVVLFTNDRSGSAIILEGALSTLKKKWRETFRFIKLSNDDCHEIGDKYRVQNIPTVLVFDGGDVVEKISGVPPKGAIENVLQKLKGRTLNS